MAILSSAREEPDVPAGLSPTEFRAKCIGGGSPSSVEMGQENVIALLLQQQEEVLREIRNQKKARDGGLALSRESKQEIARLVISSLKQQRLHRPAGKYGEPPQDESARQSSMTILPSANRRPSKKRSAKRHRRKNSRARRDQPRVLQKSLQDRHTSAAAPGPESYEYSSSGDRNTRGAALDSACFPPQQQKQLAGTTGACDNRDDRERSISTTTVIRQRVESREQQLDVSLDGLWLPSLPPPSLPLDPSPGAAANGRFPDPDNSSSVAQAGGRPRPPVPAVSKSKSSSVPTPSLSLARSGENTPVSRSFAKSGGARPVTVTLRLERGRVHPNDQAPKARAIATARSHVGGRPGVDPGDAGGGRTREQLFTEEGGRSRRREGNGASASTPTNISQDTATMLEISRALVARAKACCGQATLSTPVTPCNGVEDRGRPSQLILFASSPWPITAPPLPSPSKPSDDALGDNTPPGAPVLLGAAEAAAPDSDPGRQTNREPSDDAGDGDITGNNLVSTPTPVERHQQPTGGGGCTEPDRTAHPQRVQRDSGELQPASLSAMDDARAPRAAAKDGDVISQETRESEPASLSSSIDGDGPGRRRCGVKGGGRRRGNASTRKRRSAGGNGGGGGGGGGSEDGNPAKVDTEWENEIAKNILSLYQTKLKADLDVKNSAKTDELSLKRRRERGLSDVNRATMRAPQQQRRQRWPSNRAATAAPGGPRFPARSGEGAHSNSPKPNTAAAATTTTDTAVVFRSREVTDAGGGGTVSEAGASPSRRRCPPTPATKPREVVVGRDHSLGRQQPQPLLPLKRVAHAVRASSSKVISVPTRGGGEAVVVVPKRPRPIWFAGSGAIQAEWSALPGGVRVARDLEGLEERGRRAHGIGLYSKYVAVVEGLLTAHLRADDQGGPAELVKKLWRQLVATCIAFGVRATENRRFERALELLKRAGTLLSRQVLDKRASTELQAFVNDAYGLYFLRRGKSSAALDYVQKAMKTHARMQDWAHVTKCHLHSSVVLSKLNRHDEALRCLGQVLAIVQEGKLDVGGNSPQKLCLVAICYHNMAVEQLILRHAGEACMSSQNARRLARLCLSYSNRWLHSFEGTHKLALAELGRSLRSPASGGGAVAGPGGKTIRTGASLGHGSGSGGSTGGGEGGREQREMLQRLTEELFS
ncbi:unnamed protein product [Scytosiphon promiscuus]